MAYMADPAVLSTLLGARKRIQATPYTPGIALACVCVLACLLASCKSGGGPPAPVVTKPAISFVSLVSGEVGTQKTVTAGVSGSASSYAWDFGGGATPNTSSSSSPTVTLGAAGNYSGHVTVGNSAGSTDFTFQFTVTAASAGNAPVISSISPTQGISTHSVVFSAVVNGPADSIYNYKWEFTPQPSTTSALIDPDWAFPMTSPNGNPNVQLKRQGTFAGKVTVTSQYGKATQPFQFQVNQVQQVNPDPGLIGYWETDNLVQTSPDIFDEEVVFHIATAGGADDEQPIVLDDGTSRLWWEMGQYYGFPIQIGDWYFHIVRPNFGLFTNDIWVLEASGNTMRFNIVVVPMLVNPVLGDLYKEYFFEGNLVLNGDTLSGTYSYITLSTPYIEQDDNGQPPLGEWQFYDAGGPTTVTAHRTVNPYP